MQHNARHIMYDATAHNACCADLQQAEVINSAGLVIGHPENALPPQRPQMALTSGSDHPIVCLFERTSGCRDTKKQTRKYKGKGKDQQPLVTCLVAELKFLFGIRLFAHIVNVQCPSLI